MTRDEEIVSLTLSLEEAAESSNLGQTFLRIMCREAARTIRKMRPDLAFTDQQANDGR